MGGVAVWLAGCSPASAEGVEAAPGGKRDFLLGGMPHLSYTGAADLSSGNLCSLNGISPVCLGMLLVRYRNNAKCCSSLSCSIVMGSRIYRTQFRFIQVLPDTVIQSTYS